MAGEPRTCVVCRREEPDCGLELTEDFEWLCIETTECATLGGKAARAEMIANGEPLSYTTPEAMGEWIDADYKRRRRRK